MFKKRTLDEIGKKYNTDKSSTFLHNNETYSGHDYLRYYDFFLSSLRDKKITFIELGIFRGASLKMWRDYFKAAKIVGVDNTKIAHIEEERIDVIYTDVPSDDLLSKLEKYKGTIWGIVDDCSHAWSNQRVAFETLFPLLESGGFYIIEDFWFGSRGDFMPPVVKDSQSFFDYMRDRLNILRVPVSRGNSRYRPFFMELPRHVQELELSIDFVTFVPGAIVIRKK